MGTPELFDEMGQLNKKDIQVIIADDNMSATLFLRSEERRVGKECRL